MEIDFIVNHETNPSVQYLTVTLEEEGQRLDNYLLRVLKGVPRSHIYRIVRGGEVRLNRKRAKPTSRLSVGDQIRIPPLRRPSTESVCVHADLANFLLASILYEDEQMIVLSKPAGIAVHGGSGLSLGVIEAMRNIRQDLTYLELVHRLDKETSGCLMLAKKRSSLRVLQALLEAKCMHKVYWALLVNPWQGPTSQWVEVALRKSVLKSGERMVMPDETGKQSSTHFKLLENYAHACLVEASPKTGRTHQIRVHAAHMGHPVVGDKKYGHDEAIPELCRLKQRMYLHARAIRFNLNEKSYYFEAALDEPFAGAITQLGGQARHG